ncbi:MAG: Rieske 2Fe-2S domain-containing protein [Pseudomonadota bacterium]
MGQSGFVSDDVLNKVKGWAPYVDAKMGFRNHWYPVVFGDEIKEGEPKPVKLLGEKILINRIDGKLYAIKDRCLHRGVTLSDKVECHSKNTISCWYHGWTYRWDTGLLVDILTNPDSVQIGRHSLKVYPVEEAKDIVFVFVGDVDAPPLSEDVPPGFLDEKRVIHGQYRNIASNWRIGAENGFDASHVFIHKDSVLVKGNDIVLPLGFSPGDPEQLTRSEIEDNKPKGVYDLLGAHSVPVFDGKIEGESAIQGHMGTKHVAHDISIWLPGVLRVDPWPTPGMTQYEWYVPIDADNHIYFQTLGKLCETEDEGKAFKKDVDLTWKKMALNGFNDDDILARVSQQPFYEDERGWTDEILFEPDKAIIEWRRMASKHNRGIQSKADL